MSVMKILAVTLLVCAMVVLNEAERPAVCPPGPFPLPYPPAPRSGPRVEAQADLFKREYGCPSGWYRKDQFCYLYVATSKTWHAAEHHCKNLGGHLASAHSGYSSNTFFPWIVETYGPKERVSVWFGAETDGAGHLRWIDGSKFEPKNFRGGQGHCLRMTWDPRNAPVWDALPCSYALPSVCARRL